LVKSEIIKELHKKHPGLNRSQIEAIVEAFFSTILENLEKDRPVELRDFGRFSVKQLKLDIMQEILRRVKLFMCLSGKKFPLKCQNI